MDNVHRFLVTGKERRLLDFDEAVMNVLNPIEQRGETVLYTCFGKDREFALKAAETAEVTVQEWNGKTWEVLVGSGPGWINRRPR